MYRVRLECPIDSTNRSRPTQFGSVGSWRSHFWKSRYAVGAMLIAVPGWPLPTFCTASIARTRAVSMARRSSSVKPSGSVGCGWRGDPVGVSLAASAGASAWVLSVLLLLSLVMWRSVLPRGSVGVGPARVARGASHPGRTTVHTTAAPVGAVGESEAWARRRPRPRPYPLHAQSQRDQTL